MTESDPLVRWRAEFPIVDTCTYLVSHSLGAMPRRAEASLRAFADAWSRRGVRAWSEGWWEMGIETANLLCPILGVPSGSTTMHQNVTVAQGLVASCFDFRGPRRRVVMSELDFPTNMYVYEGFRQYGAEVVYVPGQDRVRVSTERLVDAIDERTLLVPISLVLFKSSHLVDIAPIVEKAHAVGAHVVLDVYQAAGALPLDLEALGVSFAVGGSVKWLCGGPGAGYLYVRPDLADRLRPGLAGWAGHAAPFEFEVGPLRPAAGAERFQTGTPNVPVFYAARAGYEIIGAIGAEAIRRKSLRLTGRLIAHARARGYRLNTPEAEAERGGAVIVDVPRGEVVARTLIERGVIVDYRPEAGIRMAPHFYNTEDEIDHAAALLDEIVGAPIGS